MKVEMIMPQMGESIAEGAIVKWLKGVGDLVELDEDILEISTDKVDSEIPSPATGRIVEILSRKVRPSLSKPFWRSSKLKPERRLRVGSRL